jgi:hypothetical protein
LPIIGGFVRWRRLVQFGPAGLVVVLSGVMLAACNYLIPDNAQNRSPNIVDQTQSVDLLPRFPEPSGSATVNHAKDFRGGV